MIKGMSTLPGSATTRKSFWGTSGAQYRYMRIRRSAVDAFAAILKINAFDVTITEKSRPEGEYGRLFRLGTRFPVELPVVKKPDLGLSTGAIDI